MTALGEIRYHWTLRILFAAIRGFPVPYTTHQWPSTVNVPFFVTKNSSMATSLPLSLPTPLSLIPPKGASDDELFPVF